MVDNQTPNDGASEGTGGNRRRRRRGNRRPEDRPTSTESSSETSRPQPSSQPASSGEAPSSSSDQEGGGERRGRNRRRKKKGPRPEGAAVSSEAGSDTDEAEAAETAGAAPASQQPRQERPDRPERQERRRDGNREKRRDQPQKDGAPPQEKKERAPRGSVLQRRSTRGSVDLDAALAKETEEPSAPMPIATDVDTYIKQLKGWQREVVTTLRGIVRNQARDAEEGIMWSQPVYTLNGPVCYIKAFSDHVNFGFWRGNELDDPEDLLTGELPTMRHVTIRHVNDVKRDAFEALVRSAVKLNIEKGDPT